jgi:hypothetical protein
MRRLGRDGPPEASLGAACPPDASLGAAGQSTAEPGQIRHRRVVIEVTMSAPRGSIE